MFGALESADVVLLALPLWPIRYSRDDRPVGLLSSSKIHFARILLPGRFVHPPEGENPILLGKESIARAERIDEPPSS